MNGGGPWWRASDSRQSQPQRCEQVGVVRVYLEDRMHVRVVGEKGKLGGQLTRAPHAGTWELSLCFKG